MTTSEQARADAMADAETLNLYCAQFDSSHDAIGYSRYGSPVVSNISGIKARIHAAFRAVPGLRG